jgi:indolepyruvate ferredoxin oxidoreductase
VVEATDLALALLGDAIATNLFMLGHAWQQGLVPLALESITRAIELNGAAVAMNTQAFAWGRMAAHDPAAVQRAAFPPAATPAADTATALAFRGEGRVAQTLEETLAIREAFLTEYQDAAYARDYRDFVEHVRQVERERTPAFTGLAEAVARYLFKLMAYKDEYEVARLYSTGDFAAQAQRVFEDGGTLHLNLAPPMFSKRDSRGHLVKREFGPWMFGAMRLLRRFKFLRGGAFDPFGRSAERRMERQLITDYRATVESLLAELALANHALAVEIARIPEQIRGFGHVKEAHLAKAKAQEAVLLARWPQVAVERAA